MKRLFFFILLFFLVALYFFSSPSISKVGNVQAQSCSGSLVCGKQVTRVCSPTGCVPNTAGCPCSDQCGVQGGTVSASCTGYSGSAAACNAQSICGAYAAICLKSGSCSYTPPSTGGGGGTGGGGTTCNGSCFGGISNCGAVGRSAGSGSCASGQLCCGGTGGGGPAPVVIPNTNSFCNSFAAQPRPTLTLNVGQSATSQISAQPGTYSRVVARSNNGGIAQVSPGNFTSASGTSGPYSVFNTTVTGIAAGSTTVSLEQYATYPGYEALYCTSSYNVVVNSPIGPPGLTLTANPTSVNRGGSTALSWQVANVSVCTASGGWSGNKNGGAPPETISNLQNTTTFTLTCTGPGGTISRSVTVTVNTPPPAAPTLSFSGNPTTVSSGGGTTLSWSSTNTTSCSASNGWSGGKSTSGSEFQGGITSPRSFVLSCSGPGGSVSQTVNVNVAAAPPLPSVTISASPSSVSSGGSTTLTWSSNNATSCNASGGWSGGKSTSGSQGVSNLTASTTFVITCSGSGGSSSASTSVNVTAAPQPAPTLSFSGNPTTVTSGGSTTLNWSSTNTTSCTASNAWSGSRSTSGSQLQTGITSARSFVLSCSGPGGTVTQTVNINVTAAPVLPSVDLNANPTNVNSGGSSTLSWTTTNATSCSASGGWSGVKANSGSQTITNITSNTTYTLTCSGPGGSSSDSASVTVTVAPPAAPTLNFSGNPTTVNSGGSSTLTWSSTNTTSCTANGSWSGGKSTSGSQTVSGITSNQSYVLSCTGPGGSVSRTVNVNVSSAPALPTVNLSANPGNVTSGGSSTLNWSSSNATSCSASGGWSGGKSTSGSQTITGLSTTTTFNLSCSGPGGSSSASATVTVTAAPQPAPTLNFTGNPTVVTSGGSSTLTWSSTNTTGCTASNAWTGSRATSGSQVQTGITTARSFVLSCTGPGGSVSQTVNVNVSSAPSLPTVNLSATPATVASGGSSTLSWTTTNATSCSASGGWSGVKANNGSQVVSNIFSNTTYTLTCSGPGGSSSDAATVIVSALPPVPPTGPTVNLTATPTSVNSGGSTILNWNTVNAVNCIASGGWNGVKAVNGSQTIPNLTASTSFVLTCSGPGGTNSASTNVTVIALPLPSVNLTANPSNLVGPGTTNLNWNTTNATSCVASDAWSGPKATFGSETSSTINTLRNFLLTCSNATGSVTDTATVTYTPPACAVPVPRDPAPPVCAPNPPLLNGSITWTWPAVAGADTYSFVVVDATTGVPVPGTATGLVNGQATFNCRPNQATPDLCSRTTVLPVGSFRSVIQATSSTNSCAAQPAVTFPATNLPGIDVALCPAVAWWQSGSGHVISQGNVTSTIPATCSSAPSCTSSIVKNGSGGTPGIAIGGSSGNFDAGTGTISSTEWNAKTPLVGRQPDYAAFESLIPVSLTATDPGATTAGSAFNSGGSTDSDGYTWYRHNGDLTITSDINLTGGRKVILYVTGDVSVNGKISYNPASSFFMIIARGDLLVGSTITTAAPIPTLTGIFFTDGSFETGASDQPLNILGSVVALSGVTLERDLIDDNHTTPAESFTLSPDLISNYPAALTFKRPLWREIAP